MRVTHAAAVWAVAMLVLKADIAWLMLPAVPEEQHMPRQRRAAALRLWLVLLGIFSVLSRLPGDLVWIGKALSGYQSPWANPGPNRVVIPIGGGMVIGSSVAGLALIFAAPWIAKLLSHGPLFAGPIEMEPAG